MNFMAFPQASEVLSPDIANSSIKRVRKGSKNKHSMKNENSLSQLS